MKEGLFFQQQYNVGDELSQTFGRKPLKKYINQYDFNDNLQQQKRSYNILHQKNDSPLMTFRETQYSQTKNTKRNIDVLNHQQKLSRDQSIHQLESIDRINKKINGLINSISASCQKKKILSSQNRYRNDVPSNKKSVFQDLNIQRDRQLTQKKKSNLYCQKVNIKPYFLQFHQKIQRQVKLANNNQQNYNQDYDQKEFDSLEDRIQRISYKIQEHQKKRQKQQSDRIPYSFHQQSYKNELNDKALKSQRQLREHKFFENKSINKTIKKGSYNNNNMMSYDKSQGINKQNLIDRKQKMIEQAKQLLFKKSGYFKQKYKQLKISQKQQRTKMQHNNIRYIKTKTDNSEATTETNKKSQVKIKQQEQILSFPVKNIELLSYKTTFIKQMVKQIQLDQDFRHAKHMFGGIDSLFNQNNQNNNDEKWNMLQSELKKQGFTLDIRQVKQIFMPRDDEIDPFMSIHNSHQELIHGVIYAYQATEKHWNESIYHNWTIWQLKEAKFSSQNIDLEHKGYITVEDLTFYVNTQVDGYFRNRDLLLIFYRLSDTRSHLRKQSKNGAKFKQMMDRLLSR